MLQRDSRSNDHHGAGRCGCMHSCITCHPGFKHGCLQEQVGLVMYIAYLAYRQQRGDRHEGNGYCPNYMALFLCSNSHLTIDHSIAAHFWYTDFFVNYPVPQHRQYSANLAVGAMLGISNL